MGAMDSSLWLYSQKFSDKPTPGLMTAIGMSPYVLAFFVRLILLTRKEGGRESLFQTGSTVFVVCERAKEVFP